MPFYHKQTRNTVLPCNTLKTQSKTLKIVKIFWKKKKKMRLLDPKVNYYIIKIMTKF